MTYEEAIRQISNYGLDDEMNPEELREAVEVFRLATEKQIPKKVKFTIDDSWGIPTKQPVCPNCGSYLSNIRFIGGRRYQLMGNGDEISYCEHCGNAIDWSEVE